MPSKSPKQAKTMSAIAHGWKPSGPAGDIPVGVAKDFHAADKGKKFGKGGRGGFNKPAPQAAPGGFKPPEAPQTAQLSDPSQTTPPAQGLPPAVGGGESKPGYDRSSHFKGNPGFAEGRHEPNQSYHDEQREHFGDKADGPKSSAIPHASVPATHSIGVTPLGSNQQGSFGSPHTFRGVRGNPTPASGNPRAHRIGKK